EPEPPILIVDARELACLSKHGEVRVLDDEWEHELAALRALASAPKVVLPNIHEVAIAYRKAAVAGGLECELWLTRGPTTRAGELEMIVTQNERVLGRWIVSDIVPTSGVVSGEGLSVSAGEIDLDDRQVSSLERQQVILYTELATRVANGQIGKADRARALE